MTDALCNHVTNGTFDTSSKIESSQAIFIVLNRSDNIYALERDPNYDDVGIYYGRDGDKLFDTLKDFNNQSTLLLHSNLNTLALFIEDQRQNILGEVAIYPQKATQWHYEIRNDAKQFPKVEVTPIYNDKKITCIAGFIIMLL